MTSPRTRARLTGAAALLGVAALTAATLSPLSATADERATIRCHAPAKDGTRPAASSTTCIELEEIGDANGGNRAAGFPGYEASSRLRRAAARAGRLLAEGADLPVPVLRADRSLDLRGDRTDADDVRRGRGLRDARVLRRRRRRPHPVEAVDTDDRRSRLRQRLTDATTRARGRLRRASPRATSPWSGAARAPSARRCTTPQAAGAVGVIVFNQGNTPERSGAARPASRSAARSGVPVVGVATATGDSLMADGHRGPHRRPTPSPSTRHLERDRPDQEGQRARTSSWPAPTSTASPRATASTTTAPAAPRCSRPPRRWPTEARPPRTRCASPGGAPRRPACSGRSTTWPTWPRTTPRKFQNIALYLNFDMVGSPNYMLGVYDGNSDSFDPPESTEAPEGSAAIERMFHRLLRRARHRLGRHRVQRPQRLRPVHRASTSRPAACSPAPRASRPREEAALFGGTAGVAYDPCYHQRVRRPRQRQPRALRANLGRDPALGREVRAEHEVGQRRQHRPRAAAAAGGRAAGRLAHVSTCTGHAVPLAERRAHRTRTPRDLGPGALSRLGPGNVVEQRERAGPRVGVGVDDREVVAARPRTSSASAPAAVRRFDVAPRTGRSGRSSSSVPWTHRTGTSSGTIRIGSTSASPGPGGWPRNASTAPPPSPASWAARRSSTPAWEMTWVSPPPAAAQVTRWPPAEWPSPTTGLGLQRGRVDGRPDVGEGVGRPRCRGGTRSPRSPSRPRPGSAPAAARTRCRTAASRTRRARRRRGRAGRPPVGSAHRTGSTSSPYRMSSAPSLTGASVLVLAGAAGHRRGAERREREQAAPAHRGRVTRARPAASRSTPDAARRPAPRTRPR